MIHYLNIITYDNESNTLAISFPSLLGLSEKKTCENNQRNDLLISIGQCKIKVSTD